MEKKGEGQSIIASDFLMVEWGQLRDGDKYIHHDLKGFNFGVSEAWVIFKAGKN